MRVITLCTAGNIHTVGTHKTSGWIVHRIYLWNCLYFSCVVIDAFFERTSRFMLGADVPQSSHHTVCPSVFTRGLTDAPIHASIARNSTELTPCSWVLAVKLTGPELVKKFPVFYGTRSFITSSRVAHHLTLSWDRSIQFIRFLRSVWTLSFHLLLGLRSGLSPSRFSIRTVCASLPHTCHMPRPFHFSWFDHRTNIFLLNYNNDILFYSYNRA